MDLHANDDGTKMLQCDQPTRTNLCVRAGAGDEGGAELVGGGGEELGDRGEGKLGGDTGRAATGTEDAH